MSEKLNIAITLLIAGDCLSLQKSLHSLSNTFSLTRKQMHITSETTMSLVKWQENAFDDFGDFLLHF